MKLTQFPQHKAQYQRTKALTSIKRNHFRCGAIDTNTSLLYKYQYTAPYFPHIPKTHRHKQIYTKLLNIL